MKLNKLHSKRATRAIVFASLFAATLAISGCLPKIETRSQPAETAATAPEFQLRDSKGATYSLRELTAAGPAVVVFYRGYW